MHNFSGPELGKSAGVLRSYSRPSFTEPVDFVLDDYPRSSMMWGSIRFTLRKGASVAAAAFGRFCETPA